MFRLYRVCAAAVAAGLLVAACSSTTSGEGGPGSTAPAGSGPASMSQASNPAPAPDELPAAAAIKGVTYKAEDNRNHQDGVVQYDSSPPIGGAHSPIPADCTGTVYPNPIANENAVHSLEHGAVWVTYRPGLSADEVAALARLVQGQPYVLMSPYEGLSSPISAQSWGYQLRVDSAADPRLAQFINVLRNNPQTTPEYGASCSDPPFKQNPSTPGKPIDG
jgi:hypothetical protein